MKLIQNVLIIDPDRASRDMAKKLSRKGFNATFAFSPDDGLAQVIQDKPDLVILSLDPADESGLLVLKQIAKASPGSMVIVSSEKVDGFLALQCMRQGALDYLIKPISIAALLEAIQRILDHQRFLCLGIEPDDQSVINEDKTLVFGNDPERIPYLINQAALNARRVCEDTEMLKMALGEIVLNAIEHGNLGITMEEKAKAVKKGSFEDLVRQRKKNPRYADRMVTLHIYMNQNTLEYTVIDEGEGFDYKKEFNADPNAHIGSGLGIQIAKTFFTEVRYEGCGNSVQLVYRKDKGSKSKQWTPARIIRDEFIIQLLKSFPSGLLVISDKNEVILWNKTAQKITSIKSSDILGKTMDNVPEIVKNLSHQKKNK